MPELQQLSEQPGLPAIRQLFHDPGESHAAMLAVFDEVLAELKAEGVEVDPADFLLRSQQAWQVWKRYAPSL